MVRVWPVLFWTLGLGVALAAPAAGQNLDAGKSPAQIFSEACAGCHRSVRDFKNGVSASFLREHYTTGSDMASTMAAYLTGVRTEAPRTSSPKSSGAAATREPTSTENPRGRPQQASEPKAAPKGTRPGSARAEAPKSTAAAETKPPAPPAPPPPPVAEFQE